MTHRRPARGGPAVALRPADVRARIRRAALTARVAVPHTVGAGLAAPQLAAAAYPMLTVRFQRAAARRRALGALLAGFVCAAVSALAAPQDWAKNIDALTRQDAVNPPPRHGILFVGSSSIVKWKSLERDFAGQPVINRGFGGSQLPDTTYYADRIIFPYEPRIIVVYAGENDLAAGKKAETLRDDFKTLVATIQARLPETRIVYISAKPSPSRWRIRGEIARANALIAAECARDSRLRFVDIYPLMLKPDGTPRTELYEKDMLHLKPEGYAVWVPIVALALR